MMMNCLVVDGPGKLELRRMPIPQLHSGELLIKVEAAPINPSDLLFLSGHYESASKKYPCIPGFEGSGVVLETGGGLIAWTFKGKRVAFFAAGSSGSYSEYVVTGYDSCVVLDYSISLEQGSMSLVNPLTAMAMLDKARNQGHRGILHSAAASALGRMLNRLCLSESFPLVNIVRRQQQVDLLLSEGATRVLNSSDPDFDKQLQAVCKELNVTVCFDAIGGATSGRFLKCMPRLSHLYVYGVLSAEDCLSNIDVKDFLFNGKRMTGFHLEHWIGDKGYIKLAQIMMRLSKLLKNQLKTNIAAEYSLARFPQAADFYTKNMTLGKVLIKPWAQDNLQQMPPAQTNQPAPNLNQQAPPSVHSSIPIPSEQPPKDTKVETIACNPAVPSENHPQPILEVSQGPSLEIETSKGPFSEMSTSQTPSLFVLAGEGGMLDSTHLKTSNKSDKSGQLAEQETKLGGTQKAFPQVVSISQPPQADSN